MDFREQALQRYRSALDATNGLIDRTPQPARSPELVRERSIERIARLRRVLAALGDPHLAYPVVHVGGTSGKGSTAVTAAALATAAGIRTGLHTSPYLQAATEKVQIDSQLMSAETFAACVEEVIRAAERAGVSTFTYGEAWVAIVTLALARASVELAVIEVGAGGRFDLTNVVEPAVSVITSVGLDHTETLGETIPEIAWHKAGIIKAGAPAVIAVTDPDAWPAIELEASRSGSQIIPVREGVSYDAVSDTNGMFTWWERNAPEHRYPSPMPGRFQATNAATALAAIRALPLASGRWTPPVIAEGIRAARLPGRFEVVADSPAVILDGAHNPEKIAALVRDLRRWRKNRPGRLIAIVGALESKAHGSIIGTLAPVVDEFVLTSADVTAKPAASPERLRDDAVATGFAGRIVLEPDPRAAVERAIREAAPEDMVVVTGSLYLVGNVRGRWFPDAEIVLQRTCWPETSA